jgi:hypothetical protein
MFRREVILWPESLGENYTHRPSAASRREASGRTERESRAGEEALTARLMVRLRSPQEVCPDEISRWPDENLRYLRHARGAGVDE